MKINWPGACSPARVVLLAGAAALILASAGARADDRSAESVTTLDEVIVTAQKRSENIQSVPISVTAISERSLELLGASDQLGYFFTVPALNFQSQGPTGDQHGNVSLSLRGVAATSGANTVGFYINETPIHFVNPNLFDVNRIEVLRGPQGTLYGASSMGGTIKVITNEPTADHFNGKIDLSASHTEHGSTNVDGSVVFNIPLIEGRLAARIVGYSRDDSGYINNIVRQTPQPPSTSVPPPLNLGLNDTEMGVNSEQLRGGRIALKAILTDALSITATGMQQTLRIAGDPVYKVIIDPTDPTLSYGTIAPLVNDFTHGSLLTHDINPAPQSEKFNLYDLTVKYSPGPVSLVSSTSYYDRSTSGVIDMTVVLPAVFGMSVPVAQNLDDLDSGHGFTEEVRLSSDANPHFSWLLGGFYQNVYTQFQQSLVDPNFNDEVFGGFPVVPDGVFLAFLSKNSQAQTAVFADVTVHVTKALDLAAGIREFRVNETNNTVGDGLFNGGPTEANSTSHDKGNTPRFLASYKLTDTAMVYATVSKGFRPGFGLDPVGAACDDELEALGLPLNRTQVDPDSLWNHELGFKTEFYDRRLTVNGAIYEIDWSNIQQNLSLGSCGYSTTVNSGKARSQGFEIEVAAVPIPGLELNASVSMVDAKLTANAPQVGAQSGDPLLAVAKWHAATSVTYSAPIRPQYQGYAHADYQYTGSMQDGYDFSTPVLAYENRQPGYSTINLRTGVLHNDWEVALFVDNLADARPRLFAGNFISPDISVYTMRPRTIGLNLKKSF
jgi:outer membrane receptor protein involved in Fe transport